MRPTAETAGTDSPGNEPAHGLLPQRDMIAVLSRSCAVLLLVSATVVAAERSEQPGRATYVRYCGACHGPNGRGDGVAGTFMRPKPTDLTQIARRNGGAFPFAKTLQYIDGTTDVRAHGEPDMPVWGEVFRDEPGWDNTRRGEARGKVLVITDYLQSIQDK